MTNRTEEILFEKVEHDKNKKSYVSTMLSKYSRIVNVFLDSIKEDNLALYCIRLHTDETLNNIDSSNLAGEELTYAKNVVIMRCRVALKKVKERK